MKQFKIAIVGAGISGLTTAIALYRKGFRNIQVFEQARQLGEVGAGIQLGPNAVRELNKLGFEKQLAAIADSCQQGAMYRAEDNCKLADLPYGNYFLKKYGVPGYQVLRTHIHSLLVEEVSQLGVPIYTSKTLQGIEQHSNSVSLQFSDGGVEQADLVIAADGVGSHVAEHFFPDFPIHYSGQACWRALVDRQTLGADWSDAVRVWVDSGRHMVAYPVAQSSKLNLVAIVDHPHWDSEQRVIDSSAEAWLQRFEGCSPELLRIIGKAQTSKFWGLFERSFLPTWHKGNTALIGDAAHPMLPSLAQGAAQGIEDACCLGDLLAQANSDSDIESVFAKFHALRHRRVERVQKTARWNLEYFHQPPNLRRSLRHLGMRVGGAFTAGLIARNYHWLYK